MTFIKKQVPNKKLLPLHLQFFAELKEEDLTKLQTDFTKNWTELKGLLDQQADEMKNHGETTTQTASQIKSAEDKLKTLEDDLKGITDKFKTIETKLNRPNLGQGEELKTAGERFADSEEYKGMAKANRFESQPFEVGSFYKMLKKDLDSTDPNGGILVSPLNLGLQGPMNQELRMRDLLNVQGIGTNAIEYIQETGFTNNADTVPEKQIKPESDIAFEKLTASVKTIAHWIPATRQIIADAQQLRNYVDGRLIYGLKLVEENQILYGDGTGENLTGLMVEAGVQNAGAMAGEDSRIDHIRRAITLSRLAGYPVTGIILSPRDWEAIELQKGADGHYIWVTVPAGGETRLWRVPVVESQAMQENEFLLGAFGLGSQLWDREDANVRVSEHHADYFIRNQLAILAEERLAMTTYRPESFVRGTFEAVV